ncbi:allophanate hydrolase [uncultured Salinisphaera sp.]|uniref:allophanate hydrolase n=1 Tax=uncultured Salinisphaera sp. TaxID=359372 RepID=UPI0032B1ADB8|tara:strand:- start:23407 stop:25227 length:1821 start_codon:yes stop_codon:yes gene_type:complete
MTHNLTRRALHAAYRNGTTTPDDVIEALVGAAERAPDDSAWIYRLSRDELAPYLAALAGYSPDDLPLYGLPFAIKDNIDLAGVPTTAGCPDYAYTPERHAFVVAALIAAGAIPLGKTNLDQFATGLVGERALAVYGTPDNAFDADYIPGGSSSGSAVVTAAGQVCFALGTDTAGSGRVPAAFNNLFGVKPSLGLLSTSGVVPACKSLDTISLFALTADDANAVFKVAAGYDESCAQARAHDFRAAGQRYGQMAPGFSFGVPPRVQWQTDTAYTAAMDQAISVLAAAGGQPVEVDCQPMLEAAKLLYGGPWLAERYHAMGALLSERPAAFHPVTRDIIQGGARPSAVDTFDAMYRLAECKRQADRALAAVDFMLAPTTVCHPTKAEVAAEPVAVNTRLGTWTNFMNLLDYSALAVPVVLAASGRPAGVTLFASAFEDLWLQSAARLIEAACDLPLGATGQPREPAAALAPARNATLDIVVCGAHLDGLALNHQLVERDGVCVEAGHTAAAYRLLAMTADEPPRPALIRSDADGAAIAVERWRLPAAYVGSFLAAIPAPLGLGQVELDDGQCYTGFICSAGTPLDRPDVVDITDFGGWAAWQAAGAPA